MIDIIRIVLGLFIVGPIAGILGYVFTLKPLLIGLATTLLTAALLPSTASVWSMALAAGAFAHAAMSVYATIKQYKINAKNIENAGVGAPGEGMWDAVVMSEARKEPYSPIPRGLYFGFAAANITSGYFLYGRKAQHLCDALNGVVYPKPR